MRRHERLWFWMGVVFTLLVGLAYVCVAVYAINFVLSQ